MMIASRAGQNGGQSYKAIIIASYVAILSEATPR